MKTFQVGVLLLLVGSSIACANDTYRPFLFQDYPGPKDSRLVYIKDTTSFNAPDVPKADRSKRPEPSPHDARR